MTVVVTIAAVSAWRATRRSASRGGDVLATMSSPIARAAAGLGLAPSATAGLRMALEPGRGRAAVPVRSALLGAVVGVVGVVAVVTFAASLDALVTTPRLWGATGDVLVYDNRAKRVGSGDCGPARTRLTSVPSLDSVAAVCRLGVLLDERATTAYGFTSLSGDLDPFAVVAGRAPGRSDEVALGASTLDALGKVIGDRAQVTGAVGAARYRIVGKVVFPTYGPPQPLANGAAFTGAGLARLEDRENANGDWFLIGRVAPGVDPDAAVRTIQRMPGIEDAGAATLPVEIDRLQQVDQLPIILAGCLVLLAVAAVGHVLVTSVRRRRRDLAILQTLGFTRASSARRGRVAGDHARDRGSPARDPPRTRRRSLRLGLGGRRPRGVDDHDRPDRRPAPPRADRTCAGQPRGRTARTGGSAHTTCSRPTIGVTVATSLDDIQPLDLASIRDDVRERPPWTSRATGSVVLAIASVVLVVIAALIGDRVPLGPGRVLSVALVAAWAVAAVFVAAHRPKESLAELMGLAAIVGAAILLGAALAGRDVATDTVRDFGAGMRGVAVALLPGVGLHLVLGLPDGSLRTRARRLWVAAGYAGSAVVAVYLVHDRPHVAIWPVGVLALADAVVGLVGYVARCRAAGSVHERARLQWPAWAVVVAGAISATAWVLHELVSWPEAIRAVAVATTVLIPLSLALGSSERIAVRIDRLLVHTITMAGLAAMVAASYLLIVLGLGRAPTGDEKTLLGLSMLAAAVAALLWIPVRERLTDFATRRVYGERHAPDEVIRTFGSRLTRARCRSTSCSCSWRNR